MPKLYWMPKKRTIWEDIAIEEARVRELEEKELELIPPPRWQPAEEIRIEPTEPLPEPRAWQPEAPTPQWQVPAELPLPKVAPIVTKPKEPEMAVPFWERALQVFAAPFQWVEETVIKPGLALTATATGFIPEVERMPGEEYWEWKKRSWAAWKPAGVNINVPWSDDPLRVDIRGILELAPWLLIPGAGQVGAGMRATRGIAGLVGRAGKVGKVVGYAIEYSPWGMVEKTAGVAMRAGIKAVLKGSEKMSTALGKRVFGEIIEPPISPAVAKLTTFFEETIIPARKEFEKALPALRAKQAAAIENIAAQFRRGEISATKYTELVEKATAVGGIRAGFAVKPPVAPEVTKLPEAFIKATGDDIVRMESQLARQRLVVEEARKGFEKVVPPGAILRIPRTGKEGLEELVDIDKVTPSMVKAVEKFRDELRIWADLDASTAGLKKFLAEAKAYRVPAIPKAEIGQFTKEEADDLLGQIVKATEDGFVARDSALALRDLLMTGALPEPHHIAAFAQVYGRKFAESVGKFARLPMSTKGQVLDALNLPRSVLASGDLSGTFRQGLILCLTRPQDVPRAFWRQLKYFASEKLSLSMDDTLRAHPLYQNAVRDGVEFTVLRKGARLFAKEEPFASNLAQRIPFVRKSERAFTGFLNEMRMSAYEAAHNAMTAQAATPAQFKLMGSFINIASGRGTLPANLNQYAPVLNTVLFSARYQMSTLQLPRQLGRMLISGNPYMRKQAAQALVTFVGGGATILALLKNTGAAKVEIDPRSGDFGKIIIGETRVDIWRGYLQYARFMSQFLTAQRKTAYGNMNSVERGEIAWRFIQSKLSPAAGLMNDLLKGETYMGEDLITSTKDVVRSFRERMLPLAVQDIADAVEMSGASGLWTAAPATLGIGILTYVNDFVRVKERIAKQLGYETWDEIDPATQRKLENTNPELQVAMIEFDRQIMGIAWGDWRLAGKAIENIFTENVNKAVAQYRETKDGNQFREKISDAWKARRGGYAAREEMPQFEDIVKRLKTEDTAEALVSLGPEQLAIRAYNEALFGDDMYDEFGDYKFDEALGRKEQLRRELGGEMFEYVEMYRDLKYEALPPEFHELMRAREVLRPYWEVRSWAEKTLGKPKTEWQQKRLDRLIGRIRKRLRAMNPEVEKYYQMFYVQS